MKRGIVLYQSKYGSTLKYARWLSEHLAFDLAETKKVSVSQLKDYEIIVLGGGIYASGISGLNFLKKNRGELAGKKIITFCVGASPYDEKAFKEVYEHNFKGNLEGLPCYYCRGAWKEQEMTFADRSLCRLLQKAVAKKSPEEYEPWETALMSAMGKDCDWTEKKYLDPVIEACQE